MKNLSQSKSYISQLNLLLVALVAMLVVLYVFSVNKVAVLEYSISSARGQLVRANSLTETLSKSGHAGMSNLLTFARANNMVEVKNYEAFFQEAGIAIKN